MVAGSPTKMPAGSGAMGGGETGTVEDLVQVRASERAGGRASEMDLKKEEVEVLALASVAGARLGCWRSRRLRCWRSPRLLALASVAGVRVG
jgi:hypothetical protein